MPSSLLLEHACLSLIIYQTLLPKTTRSILFWKAGSWSSRSLFSIARLYSPGLSLNLSGLGCIRLLSISDQNVISEHFSLSPLLGTVCRKDRLFKPCPIKHPNSTKRDESLLHLASCREWPNSSQTHISTYQNRHNPSNHPHRSSLPYSPP